MQELTQTEKTMSSVEIAKLTGKRHDNVMSDCRRMFQELSLSATDFSGTQKYGNNNTRSVYNLDKLMTINLITGYDVKRRHAINKRWMELESLQTAPVLPQSYSEALRALADKTDENNSLAEKNNELIEAVEKIKPVAKYGESILNTGTVFTTTNAGQELGLTAVKLNLILFKQLHVIKRGTGNTDYEICAKYMNNGFTKHITTTYKNSKGEDRLKRSLRWTRKGFDWLILNKDYIKDTATKSLAVPTVKLLYGSSQ